MCRTARIKRNQLIRRESEIQERRLGNIEYLLQYKTIRRMYLRLKGPEAKVFVTAPYHTALSEVEKFISNNIMYLRNLLRKHHNILYLHNHQFLQMIYNIQHK